MTRRAVRPGEPDAPPVERTGHVWRVRSASAARQVLRERRATTQAGFTAEWIPKGFLKHHPILISDGPLHDEQRSAVGRFFAPKVVAERYLALMEQCADRLLAASGTELVLDQLALLYTVEVTAQAVGLTESSVPAMARRLESFFNQPPFDLTRDDLGRTPRQWALAAWRGLVPVLRLYLADVRPAIRARRKTPGQDVISHLIEQGYTDADILVECVTYGTAGMVTTREFIAMAAWHLLGDEPLRARFLVAGQAERHAILNEVIRLEPVVGHLYRRVQEPFTFTGVSTGSTSGVSTGSTGEVSTGSTGEVSTGSTSGVSTGSTSGVSTGSTSEHTPQPGDLIDLCVRPGNADPATVGDDPLELRPGRPLPRGVDEAVLSFGDGAHRCPGQPLAILEADVLLSRLLARDVRIVTEPTIGWDDLIAGYTLRGFRLRVGPAT